MRESCYCGRTGEIEDREPEVGARHVLATAKGEQFELRVPAAAGVIVTDNGDVRTKEALRADGRLKADGGEHVYALGLHERAEVALGSINFVVRFVKPSPVLAVNQLKPADYTWFKILSISLLGAAAVVAAMVLTPRSETPNADDVLQAQQRVAKFLVAPTKPVDIKRFQDKSKDEGEKVPEEDRKPDVHRLAREDADRQSGSG